MVFDLIFFLRLHVVFTQIRAICAKIHHAEFSSSKSFQDFAQFNNRDRFKIHYGNTRTLYSYAYYFRFAFLKVIKKSFESYFVLVFLWRQMGKIGSHTLSNLILLCKNGVL